MFSTRSLTIIHKYLIKYFNKKSIYILKLFFFICLISLFTPIYSSAGTKIELHPDGYPAIDEYNRHIVDLTQINDVSSITHDQGNTIDHPDYIIKLPDNGLTINNNDEGDSVISFMAHAENKFSILFDGDLTINKTGALITNNAGISINTEAESGVYTIDGNLIINLNNIGVNKYTGALNAFAGDFNVTGDTTVSVDNLSNLRTYSNLDFAGITIGGGADIQNAQEKNYTFNNITINKINAISNASVTDSNLAKVYGLYLDSYAYDSDTFNDMELDRTFTAADLTIESISLTAQNPYDAFSAGIMNNGVTAQLDSLYIDGITVNAKGSAESYGVMIKPGTEKQASLVVDELATVSNIHAFSDTDAYSTGIQVEEGASATFNGGLVVNNITAQGEHSEAFSLLAYNEGKITALPGDNHVDIKGDIGSFHYGSAPVIDIAFSSSRSSLTGMSFTTDGGTGDAGVINLAFGKESVWNIVPGDVNNLETYGHYTDDISNAGIFSEVTDLENNGHIYVGSTAESWINNTRSDNLFASSPSPLSPTDRPTELIVNNLSGTGDFHLRTELNHEGETDRSDSVRITDSLAGSYNLHVMGSGDKEVQSDSYLARAEDNVATTGDEFSLAPNKDGLELVDIGRYNYKLETDVRNDGREWYLIRSGSSTTPDSPTGETEASLSGFAGHYAMWYGYQTDLRKRLGEIRYGTQTGLWVRGFADKVRLHGLSGTNFTQNLVGGSIGYDTPANVDETHMWILGMQIRSGHADQSTNGRWGGYGDLTSVGGGLYSTWVHVDGWYLDAVATMDWFNHEIRTAMLNGSAVHDDRSSYGIGASLEAGRKMNFAFSNEGLDYWFLEPQLQLSWFWVRGGDYMADNGMTIEQNDMASLTGRAGLVLGKKITLEDDHFHPRYVQPYIKAGLNHEFLGDQTARINGHRYTSELDGTRVYYGFGADWQATDNLRIYMQAEREHGENFTREYNISAGLKWLF